MANAATSQALNAGTAAGVTTDYFGEARPQSTGFDIGYDEAPYNTPHWITPTAGANGSLSPSTAQFVAAGSALTFTMAAAANYHIVDVGVDGVSQGAISSYTFSNITADHTITASFALNTYTLTVATAGTGSGVVTPTVGVYTYTHGSVVTLTGLASSDPDSHTLTYAWTQTSGVSVTLTNAASAQPTFTAPSVTTTVSLTFQLLVTDAFGLPAAVPDSVAVVVNPYRTFLPLVRR